ncbi:MAG: Sir2 silent information regulator family NAD-dependent deacetylase [Eubacteriales bacterium]
MNRELKLIKEEIARADCIVVGAGAGLSTSAGLEYGGERFERLFPDYIKEYGLTDMYSSAFYDFPTSNAFWGYFCKHILHNRYESEINDCYSNLLGLLEGKNYFVITTNADHLFLRNGFPKERLFYLQGDYGLFQCSVPCHQKTYDNQERVYHMVDSLCDLKIPDELLPLCPECGAPMDVNLRKDGSFVEDEGWHAGLERYQKFLGEMKKPLFLELGVGYNTPSIIKYPFWRMTHRDKKARYLCLNAEEGAPPKEISKKSVYLCGDIATMLRD